MPLTEIATALSLEALKLALRTTLGSLARAANRTASEWNVSKVADHLANVPFVRPLWNPSTEVDLIAFHYPCPVRFGERSLQLVDLASIESPRAVITGIVGQGKSMLLRFLARQELLSYTARATSPIPLFLELRRMQPAEPFHAFLARHLGGMGIPIDDKGVEHLLKENGFALLLDGFDETVESARPRLVDEIERMAARHSELRVVITSRPRISGIERLAGFRSYELPALGETAKRGVILSQFGAERKHVADKLLTELRSSPVEQLLTTPLMVALLVIHYSAYGKLPAERESFHEDLFDALLRRHDAAKPGFVRPRQSKLSDHVLRSWFDRMSFLVQKDSVYSWDRYSILKLVSTATPPRGQASSTDDVLEDICNITSLILEEGGEYRFAHKMVVEYHAASYIRGAPQAIARKFYNELAANRGWQKWRETLEFLSRIDRYRYLASFERHILKNYVNDPSIAGIFPLRRTVIARVDETNQKYELLAEGSWFRENAPEFTHKLMREITAAAVGPVSILSSHQRAQLGELGQLELVFEGEMLDSLSKRQAIINVLTDISEWASERIVQIDAELDELATDEEMLEGLLD